MMTRSKRSAASLRIDRNLPVDRYTFTLDAPDAHQVFRLNVVPGDADRNGKTNALDLGAVRARLGGKAVPPSPENFVDGLYVRTMDLNGDGRINALDLGAIKANLNKSLPAGTPATALLR